MKKSKKRKKSKKFKKTRRVRKLEESFKKQFAYDKKIHKGLVFAEDTNVLIMPMHELRVLLRDKYSSFRTMSTAEAVLRLCDDHEHLETIAGIKRKGGQDGKKEIRIIRIKHSEGRKLRRVKRYGNRQPDDEQKLPSRKPPAKERRIQRIK